MAIACGIYGLFYLDQEKRAVAAEEAREKADAEKKKAEEAAQKANPFLKAGSLDKLRMITKVTESHRVHRQPQHAPFCPTPRRPPLSRPRCGVSRTGWRRCRT